MPEADDGNGYQASGRRLGWTLAIGLALVGLLAVSASAQNTTQLTITAREDCAETTFCFEITGDLDNIQPGSILDITFENPSDNLQEHNVHLALGSEANVGSDQATEARTAFASTEDLAPGNQTTLSAQIPEEAESVYLWCTIRAHEQQGMFREVELAGTQEGGGGNGSPGFGTIAAVGAVVGLAALLRRR